MLKWDWDYSLGYWRSPERSQDKKHKRGLRLWVSHAWKDKERTDSDVRKGG